MTDTHPVLALLQSGAAQGQWTLAPANSSVEFGVKHFWHAITIRGRFEHAMMHAIEAADDLLIVPSSDGQLHFLDELAFDRASIAHVESSVTAALVGL